MSRCSGAGEDEVSRRLQRLASELSGTGLSLIVEKDGAVLFTSGHVGLRPLVQCLADHGHEMTGALVADKVVGTAAARLLTRAGVAGVATPLASSPAVDILLRARICLEVSSIVPAIKDSRGTGQCPMEQLSRATPDTGQLFKELLRRFGLGQAGPTG